MDLIELPRLQLSFYSKVSEDSVMSTNSAPQLYCTEYVGMFISNIRTDRINKLINGINHAIILQNVSGEVAMVIPALSPVHLHYTSKNKPSEYVFFHSRQVVSHHIYPIHISKVFLFTPTIESSIYLLLLRALQSQHHDAMQLVDSCMSDSVPSPEAANFWALIQHLYTEVHPNAHAIRLKLILVSQNAGYITTWNLEEELSNYISKLRNISTVCRLTIQEEFALLQQATKDYKLTNRKNYLELVLNGAESMPVQYPPRYDGNDFDSVVDKSAVDTGLVNSFMNALSGFTVVTYKQPAATRGVASIQALNKWMENGLGIYGGKDDLGFLFMYELLSGTIAFGILPNDDPYYLGSILVRHLPEKERDPGLMMSILRILMK